MGVLAILTVVLPLLQGVLSVITKSGLPAEIITMIESAITNLQSAQTQLLTYGEVESLKIDPQW